MSVIFCTLGPEGTCHDNATKKFIQFQGLSNATITYTKDFFQAAEAVINKEVDFLIQNVAHPQVAELCPKFRDKLYIIDTFVFPTIPMGILVNKTMKSSKKVLGLMPAAVGYINKSEWHDVITEVSNPIVAQSLLAGKYQYGISFTHYAETHNDVLEVVEDFGGAVDTAWIVYGRNRNFKGDVLGIQQKKLYVVNDR